MLLLIEAVANVPSVVTHLVDISETSSLPRRGLFAAG